MSHRYWPILALAAAAASGAAAAESRPDVVIVTVDTLRADRLSGYGYERPTSPALDRLTASGLRFEAARTVEPLTSPASCSIMTSVHPHVHGSTRNGLRMRPGLPSLPKLLREQGYRTAAFVGNWTLRDKLSGLGEHFDAYEEVLSKKRWWGLVRREAGAAELNELALDWVAEHRRTQGDRPFLLWLHYTEPHAPYVLHRDLATGLGIDPRGDVAAGDRYDTEIAFVDRAIGRLLAGLETHVPREELLLVFSSDHGESLGEHGYWGHGRNLHEPTLWIPLAIVWESRLAPRTIRAPALSIDIGPTVLGLLGLPPEPSFEGFDWSEVVEGASEPFDRVTRYQAHRGAVLTQHDSETARRSGLLAVATLEGARKEILRAKNERRSTFDLATDPGEIDDLALGPAGPTAALVEWLARVSSALGELDVEPPPPLDDETIERLRALGYAD
jgi:arylsulfatase A-like enzyme